MSFCTACNVNTGKTPGSVNTEQQVVAPAAAAPQEEDESVADETGMKKIGDTVTYRSTRYNDDGPVVTEMEYTVQKVEIFDHYTDTGIPESEFSYGISDQKMIMLEVKVKKVSGPAWQDEDDDENISCLQLNNKRMMEDQDNACMAEVCYFSGHGVVNEEGKGYNRYRLDPGEEAVFQVGWCVHDPWTGIEKDPVYLDDTEGLTLFVGMGGSQRVGEYIDLTV